MCPMQIELGAPHGVEQRSKLQATIAKLPSTFKQAVRWAIGTPVSQFVYSAMEMGKTKPPSRIGCTRRRDGGFWS